MRLVIRWLRSRPLVFLHDLAWVPACVVLAYLLRFNFDGIPPENFQGMVWTLAVMVPVFAGCFWLFGIYRAMWRYVSFPDLTRLLKAVSLGVMISALGLFVLQRFHGIPRSTVVLFPILLMAGLAAPRLLYRWLREMHGGGEPLERRRALVVGAGHLGEVVIRHLLRNGQYLPTAVVDPDPRTKGKEIHGIRVLGDLRDVPHLIAEERIQMVILATDTATATEVNQLVGHCATASIPCRTVPLRRDAGGSLMEEFRLRPVTIEDLLRRSPVSLEMPELARKLHDRRVLISGGGGSIGSELCRQVAAQAPHSLVICESSEYNLYQIEEDLRQKFPGLALHAILGDVKHEHTVETIFRRFAPEVVFHAAAYKHVPLLEANLLQAVHNNVLGTRMVADAAHRHGSDRFVLISTDKAVNPTNVMGATKRAAEVYCQNLDARSQTRFITTRFGNVLGSVGSVVPRFEQQIATGGPVTVTHPEMRRYFMTIPEAVSLILQAAAMGEGGEIFVLDMGEPVRIVDLAEQMIHLAGYTPYKDIPIVFTGLRPGEKLFEELFHQSEALLATDNPKLLLAARREVDWGLLGRAMGELEAIVQEGRRDSVLPFLERLVPEFNPRRAESDKQGAGSATPHLRVVK